MKNEGYSSKMRYALINADDLENEVALCGHSEKLVMATDHVLLLLPIMRVALI